MSRSGTGSRGVGRAAGGDSGPASLDPHSPWEGELCFLRTAKEICGGVQAEGSSGSLQRTAVRAGNLASNTNK